MNHQAIYNTHPSVVRIDDSAGAMDEHGNIVAIDKAIYDAEVSRLEAEQAATQYQRDRKAEYPSIEECVHAILDGELDALQAIRAEIKARYPK
jgi:hypothetical protein